MDINTAHRNLFKFAPQTVSLQEFRRVLEEDATPSNPVKVEWETMEGKTRYYDMYWIDGPLGDGIAGGTNTKARNGMVNIPVIGLDGTWRTLTYDTITKFRFNNKTFRVQ